jgi:hypothetical protein
MKFLMLVLILGSSGAALCAPGFPITCKFDTIQAAHVTPVGSGVLMVSFNFRHGLKPASDGVEPGTCAWQDRAMNPDEPFEMRAYVKESYTYVSLTGGIQIFAPEGAQWVTEVARGGRLIFKNVIAMLGSGTTPYLKIQ